MAQLLLTIHSTLYSHQWGRLAEETSAIAWEPINASKVEARWMLTGFDFRIPAALQWCFNGTSVLSSCTESRPARIKASPDL